MAPSTINDLNLSEINPDAKLPSEGGEVKGASATAEDKSTTIIIALELGAVAIAAVFIVLSKRRKRIHALEPKLTNN